MTPERKKETEFVQGYWVEMQNGRLAGGVSAKTSNIEGGLGAVYTEEKWGLTGYVQYTLPYLFGRVQLDLLSDQRWVPQISAGIPLSWQQFKLEPHLGLALEKDKTIQPRFGLRVQYEF